MTAEIERCTLCPRRCGAKRAATSGQGVCGMGMLPSVARAALHFWEEPCISGTRGSGAVFFTGCPLGCVYCQNAEISNAKFPGKSLSVEELAELFHKLERQGAHNLNLVNPTHFVPAIIEALRLRPVSIPVVYNSGGYETVETLRLLEGLVDVYLPDMKYGSAAAAQRYSRAADYPEIALAAIGEMVRQRGAPVFGGDGMLQSGVLVRHLILPGRTNDAIRVLTQLRERFGGQILVSLLAQYLPWGRVDEAHFSELNRRITRRELEKVETFLLDSGLEGYVQERESAQQTYIPPFNFDGLS